MRKWIVTGLLGVVACLAWGAFAAYNSPDVKLAGSFVEIHHELGRGSGVHIGDGLILTAAHVTAGITEAKIVDDLGHSVVATVVKSDVPHDVSLLKFEGVPALGKSPIKCRPNYIGQRITVHGSPSAAPFIAPPGSVIGGPREAFIWKEVFPVSVSAIDGMSGGPAIDTSGRVVGLWVGYLGANPSIGFMVPALAACALMGVK